VYHRDQANENWNPQGDPQPWYYLILLDGQTHGAGILPQDVQVAS
jgi:hypothetical protein